LVNRERKTGSSQLQIQGEETPRIVSRALKT